MKISTIKVKLTEEDIFSSIQEYVKVDNFKVESLTFGENINIACTLKKKINIALKAKIKIDKVVDNVLYLSILDVNVAKIHIFNGIKNFALKTALKDFADQGIKINKETISVDLDIIASKVPFVKFKLVSLTTANGALEAEVGDLEVIKPALQVTEGEKEAEVEIEKVVEIEGKIEEASIIKVNDKYTSLRVMATNKVPEKYAIVAEYAFLVPDILILFGRILKDKRVPVKDKLVIGSVIAYFASPIDIGLLFIPFIGEAGAVAMAFYGLSYVIAKLPEQVIMDNWQGKEEQMLKIKKGVELLNKAAGGKNIQKLLKISNYRRRKKMNKK